jgi:hypothetical protein
MNQFIASPIGLQRTMAKTQGDGGDKEFDARAARF